MNAVLGDQGQHMAINYYPPCPAPDMTYGLPAHTDPNTITILLQDPQVAGLQVLQDDKWVAVDPHRNTLVVNIGDQIQVIVVNFKLLECIGYQLLPEKKLCATKRILCPMNFYFHGREIVQSSCTLPSLLEKIILFLPFSLEKVCTQNNKTMGHVKTEKSFPLGGENLSLL